MVEVRYRVSWQLALAIVMVMTIAIIPVIIYFSDYKQIFIYITAAIVGWTVWVLIALMGAFMLGLAVGHRAASKSDFTPFEIEMLKMKEEVKALKEVIHRHNIHHKEDAEDRPVDQPPAAPTTGEVSEEAPEEAPSRPPEKPVMVEEEPELRSPLEGAPEMKPIGKVRCSQCKTVIPIYSTKRPLELKCIKCGKIGVLR